MALHVGADRFFGQRRPPWSRIPSGFSRSVRRIGGCLPNSTRHHSESGKLHLTSTGADQAFLVANAPWGVKAAAATRAAYEEIARVFRDLGLTMVHERLFGGLNVEAEVMSARSESFRACGFPGDGPLTYIQGTHPWGEGFAGVIIQAVSGDAVWTIEDEGQKVGTGWRRGDDGAQTGGLAVDTNLGWKGAEKYVATVPQVFDLWQDPQERYDIFMNNYTERTWTLVTINAEVRKLIKTYVQYPPRKLQSEVYTGPITLSQYERFKNIREKLGKEGINLPLPTGN
jgi:hypothetical protein